MSRCLPTAAVFAAWLFSGLLPAGAQAPRQRPAAPKSEPRIRVEVNLVNLLASVVDAQGRPVAGLPREAFQIYEEGVAQKVELFEVETSQPLDLALMIDSSLSTFKELSFEREAAAHFIRQVVRPGDRLGVFQFSETVTRLTDFSSDVPGLQAAARSVAPGAGTAMFDAIFLGARALSSGAAGRRRVIVLVTDAGETTSLGSFEDVRRAALAAEALLYTVLIRPVKSESGRNTAGEHALVTIADVTGGAMYYPDSVAELDGIFDRIDRELRTQYRLGYYPDWKQGQGAGRTPARPPTGFRRIEVRVKGCGAARPEGVTGDGPPSGCVVRHRRGYFIAGDKE